MKRAGVIRSHGARPSRHAASPRKDRGKPRGPMWVVVKFFGSAFFGLLVAGMVFFLAMGFGEFEGLVWLVHILWALPLLWGVLGIFWFDNMLALGRRAFEALCGIDDVR